MTENRPVRRRSRVSEHAQPPVWAKTEEFAQETFEQAQDGADWQDGQYADDRDETGCDQPDYAAYYSREGAAQGDSAQSSFAAPAKLSYYGYQSQPWPEEQAEEVYESNNVYRPRQATWASEEREHVLTANSLGYQVQAEEAPVRKKKKKKHRRHPVRTALISLFVVLALGAAAVVAYQPVMEWLHGQELLPQATQQPFEPMVTPVPIKAYDAAPEVEMASSASAAIRQLSGSLEMESYAVTDTHIITRNQRRDGSYDFYLFTSEGRLLCYFEGLGPLDMIPQEEGSYYVNQEPYLIAANGSALVQTADIERTLGATVRLHPMYHGWALVESQKDGSVNYVSRSGRLLSTLWFSRAFPFTGEYTMAYVDTGSAADADERYLLYVIGADGEMRRWLVTPDMEDVIASACGVAYMRGGDLYHLPHTDAPIAQSPHVEAYLDCGALVVKDAQSGKYGLFVHGEQHYDFAYDAIQPVPSDIRWTEKTLQGEGGTFVMHAVEGAAYPQPLSHSFVLEKDGQSEYVALSTLSSYPILLDGAF